MKPQRQGTLLNNRIFWSNQGMFPPATCASVLFTEQPWITTSNIGQRFPATSRIRWPKREIFNSTCFDKVFLANSRNGQISDFGRNIYFLNLYIFFLFNLLFFIFKKHFRFISLAQNSIVSTSGILLFRINVYSIKIYCCHTPHFNFQRSRSMFFSPISVTYFIKIFNRSLKCS